MFSKKHVKKTRAKSRQKIRIYKADDGCSRSVFCQFESLIFKETSVRRATDGVRRKRQRENAISKKKLSVKAAIKRQHRTFLQMESCAHTAQSAPVQSWSASKKRKAAQKNIASATAKAIHAKT